MTRSSLRPGGEADRGFAWRACTYAGPQPFVRTLDAAELAALDDVAAGARAPARMNDSNGGVARLGVGEVAG